MTINNKQKDKTLFSFSTVFFTRMTICESKMLLKGLYADLEKSLETAESIRRQIADIRGDIDQRVSELNGKLLKTLPQEILSKIMLYVLQCPHDIENAKIPTWTNISNHITTTSKNGYTIITEDDLGVIVRKTNDSYAYEMYFAHGDYNYGNSFDYVMYSGTIVSELRKLRQRRCPWNDDGHYAVSCYEVKNLARLNKIKGRSKFKTRAEYIKAFMGL